MNSHLAIKVAGKEMALRPDQTVDFELANPLFNNTEMFSLPFNPPFEQNRHLMKNIDDVKSDVSPMTMEGLPAVVYGDGLPLHSGITVVQEDDELFGGMSLNIDASKQSFDDLIGDLECRDVPLKDRIQIGEKLGNVHVEVAYKYQVDIHFQSGKKDEWNNYAYDNDRTEGDFEPQALGFSYPGICQVTGNKQVAVENTSKSKTYPGGHKVKVPKEVTGYANSTFINVTDAYGENSAHWGEGGAKYCNARVAYLHKGLNDDGTSSDDVIKEKDIDKNVQQYEGIYPYWVLDADRQQSGICFYVLYFLDCLFAHLGVAFDKDALLAVEDFKHLCFFTSHCRYESEPMTDSSHSFHSMEEANAWLDSRGCGGSFSVGDPEPKQIQSFDYKINGSTTPEHVEVGKGDVQSITVNASITKVTFSCNVCKMWANSDNFPEESVKTVLDSLEASFGIRFHYDYEKNKVTAYLLRDVFRQVKPVRESGSIVVTPMQPVRFNGTVNSVHKLTEKITGFRMKYSAENTAKEQEEYIRRKKTDYDTDYDYKEYPEDRTVIDETYIEIAKQRSATNMKVYVDLTTGNAYRIKIDSDATTSTDMKPVLFEVGQFHGIELGDCSSVADKRGTIREYVSDFQPMPFNDVNSMSVLGLDKERTASDGKGNTIVVSKIKNSGQPMLVAIIDEDMKHEFCEYKINNVLSNDLVDLYLTENLHLVESYDPTSTDDGNSPLQEMEWGLSIAMMRGGGTNMTIQNYSHDYDGFGNDKWRTVSGEYALTSDTIDQIGNEFDYNGVASGIGDGERFSLKITAYKPFRYKYVSGQLKISTDPKEWFGDPSWLVPCDGDVINPQTGKVETKIRTRGTFDSFMSELCYFLLHRKKVRIKAMTTVAQLADIPNHWRQLWQIGDLMGFIDKVQYQLAIDKPLGEVTIDFYII